MSLKVTFGESFRGEEPGGNRLDDGRRGGALGGRLAGCGAEGL
jgi:hypothetical protein